MLNLTSALKLGNIQEFKCHLWTIYNTKIREQIKYVDILFHHAFSMSRCSTGLSSGARTPKDSSG